MKTPLGTKSSMRTSYASQYVLFFHITWIFVNGIECNIGDSNNTPPDVNCISIRKPSAYAERRVTHFFCNRCPYSRTTALFVKQK